MDGEEKRQNDGVAIKYTTCRGEQAVLLGVCIMAPRRGSISIFFVPIFVTVSGTTSAVFSVCCLLLLMLLVFLNLLY